MRLKKLLITIFTIILATLCLGQNVIYATDGSLAAALDIYRWLPIYDASTKQYTYSKKWGFQMSVSGHRMYQINEFAIDNKGIVTDTLTGENSRLYCLNARVGTTWNLDQKKIEGTYDEEIGNITEKVTFDSNYDLKTTDKESILRMLNASTENLTSNYYSAIIWLLDNFYIPNVTDKEGFFKNIGIAKESSFYIESYSGERYYPYHNNSTYKFISDNIDESGYFYINSEGKYEDALLPDELIETVQQAVIWYFTNHLDYETEDLFDCYTPYYVLDTEDRYTYYVYNANNKLEGTYRRQLGYLPTEGLTIPTWLYYTKNGASYSSLNEYTIYGYDIDGDGENDDAEKIKLGKMYQQQAAILYNYLVDNALSANTAGYTGIETTPSIVISDSAKVEKQDDGNYRIGPITITTTGTVSGISLTANIGTVPSTITAGKSFYITDISSEFEGTINIEVSATGKGNTTQNLYIGTNENDELEQPIVKIERKDIELNDEATFTITKEKYFDLALRKTITEIKDAKGTVVSILNENGLDATRRITVDSATIPDTATYKHRKDPVIVGNGYKVTYKLSIYNEGDIDGYASIIVDQLATGLESTLKVGDIVTSIKGNVYEVTSYTDNKLILELASVSPTTIPAYNGVVGYDAIQLECKVTQKEDTSAHYLTNIAYINEAYGLETAGTAIAFVKQEQDRKNTESKPSEFPNKTASDLNNTEVTYKGKSSNQSIYNDTNNGYYYQGQEDDDDFETVVIPAKEFDLKLVKYISAINGDISKGKTVTKIDTTKLASGDSKTADYTLSKNVVTVEKGDYVTYTFRVYNEGDIDGYVTKLTDNIPLGLQFVQTSIKNDGKTITVYSYDETNGLTSNDVEVDEETYKLVDSNNSCWTIDKIDNGDVKVDAYDGDRTPSISINVADYLGGNNKLLNAYDLSKDNNNNGDGLTYVDVAVVLKVADTASINKVMRNEAAITGHTDADGKSITDRDSEPENWLGKDNHNKYQDDEDYDNIKLVRFDLALRKFITAVSSDTTIEESEYISSRIPEVDTSKLKTGEDQTAIYNHSKEARIVEAGDYVLYTIRVYNEGDIDGYASKVTDYLPEYLNYIDGEFNQAYGWEYNSSDKSVTTTYLSSENGTSNILKAFDAKNDDGKGSGLSYKDLQILCRVSTDATVAINITNIAEITEYQDENGTVKDNDPDSDPANLKYPEDVSGYEGNRNGKNASSTYYPGQEDDDDFDRVKVIKGSYDIILIKEDETGEKLNSEATFEVNGETKKIVGTLTIADDVEIKKNNVNQKDTYTIKETVAPDGYCEFDGIINIEVTKKQSSDKYEVEKVEYTVTDASGNVFNTEDAEVYLKDGNIYVEVIDYEENFDLALRKFITKINEEDVTTRIPEVSYENEKITYTHPKDVVKVVVGDTVTYTIRVYNEGKTAGYAQTVTDDIPEYLEYLPENETNKTYRWKMYDEDGNETEDVTKADKIVTDYTSKAYGEELMGADEKLTENPNLLNAFDPSAEISDTNPEYVDVKVAFKVKDPNSSSYIIKNKAQISEDSDENGNPVTDIDSVPNEWNDGEDDQDYENVSVEYFDLSLLKYVSEVEVTENGTTTTTKTGNKGDKNDIIPKVEIHRKNLDSTTVKFIYTIKITNEGDIPGYATEITDYVPEGLEFNTEDNKGWEEKEDGVITTTLLSDTLLNPGESATVKVTFRWINDEENLGVKTNIAEISDDDNEDGIPDRDSTPGNKKDGEDDIDDAEVLLSIKTGMTENIIAYVTGAAIILLVLASGVILIKKFVL